MQAVYSSRTPAEAIKRQQWLDAWKAIALSNSASNNTKPTTSSSTNSPATKTKGQHPVANPSPTTY
jgi:hypothetical protein